MKRTLYLLVAAAAVTATVIAVAPFAAAHPAAKQTTTIKVVAKEYKFILSKKSAPAGKVIFKVVNKGKVNHDFQIAGKKTKSLKPGKSAKPFTVTLKKGKKYPFKCTIDSHALFGMKGTFKAT